MLETKPTTSTRSKTNSEDFRQYLQRELVRRCQANPKYSLRSFAKFLGMESSRLSKILRGERPIQEKLLIQLGHRLGLSSAEIQGFCLRAIAKKTAIETPPTEDRHRYLQLSLDAFESIEDWRHYAVLEMMKLPGFKPDYKWVARMLEVTITETRVYVERLQRVGLLEVRTDGSWYDKSEGFSTHILSETETTYAHRRSQKKILELAIEALEKFPMDRRDQSSMMMATHSSKVLEAKKRIRKFRQELCEFLEDTEEKDTVYQLSMSLFPLVESQTKGKKV